MNRLKDFLLEVAIELVRLAFVHGPRRYSVSSQRLFIQLIKMRSAEQVSRMERKKGLV